jgi:hypothetical protein
LEGGFVLEVDPRTTPLRLIVDLVDVELERRPGRTITPLVALDDDALAGLAAAVLATPEIDRSRVLETYVEPLLAGRNS